MERRRLLLSKADGTLTSDRPNRGQRAYDRTLHQHLLRVLRILEAHPLKVRVGTLGDRDGLPDFVESRQTQVLSFEHLLQCGKRLLQYQLLFGQLRAERKLRE